MKMEIMIHVEKGIGKVGEVSYSWYWFGFPNDHTITYLNGSLAF